MPLQHTIAVEKKDQGLQGALSTEGVSGVEASNEEPHSEQPVEERGQNLQGAHYSEGASSAEAGPEEPQSEESTSPAQCYSSSAADPSEGTWRKTDGGVKDSPASPDNWVGVWKTQQFNKFRRLFRLFLSRIGRIETFP